MARIVTLLLIVTSAFAQSPPLDVSITSLETTQAGKEAILHVHNNSGKYVAAFNIALSIHHSDGTTTTSGAMVDFGYRATKDGNPKLGIPKLLRPGNSYDEHVVLDEDTANVTPKLAAVVYADRTANGDPDSVNEIIHGRQRYAERVAKENPKDANAAASYAKDDVRRQP